MRVLQDEEPYKVYTIDAYLAFPTGNVVSNTQHGGHTTWCSVNRAHPRASMKGASRNLDSGYPHGILRVEPIATRAPGSTITLAWPMNRAASAVAASACGAAGPITRRRRTTPASAGAKARAEKRSRGTRRHAECEHRAPQRHAAEPRREGALDHGGGAQGWRG